MQKTSVSALNALDNGLAEYLAYKNADSNKLAFRFGRKFHSICLENDTDTSSFTAKQQEMLLNMRDALFEYEPWLRISVINKDVCGEIKYYTTREEFISYEYKGILIKAKIDEYRIFEKEKIVLVCDLKSCQGVDDYNIKKAVKEYNILVQNASYQLALKTKYPQLKDYKFISMNCFVSKKEVPICRLVPWSDEDIEGGLNHFDALVNKFKRLDELRLDKNEYKENSLLPEPLELDSWVYQKQNKTIEKWG